MHPENKLVLLAAIRLGAAFSVLAAIVFGVWPLSVSMLPAESIAGQRLWVVGIMVVMALAAGELFTASWELAKQWRRRKAAE